MMLILGKPGGGKGTISNKVLKVRSHVYMFSVEHADWNAFFTVSNTISSN